MKEVVGPRGARVAALLEELKSFRQGWGVGDIGGRWENGVKLGEMGENG